VTTLPPRIATAALAVLLATAAAAQDPACLLPIDPGPCDGACPRWGFDTALGACVEFTWGCCLGNANNFETWAECQIACEGGDPCSLPPDAGPCDGFCPRWAFDADTGECREFVWGCCEGNANRFETREQCERVCAGCDPPADPGLIFAARDGDDVVLTWLDDPVAESWNLYRDEAPDPARWGAPHAAGVTDGDPATPGVQHRDAGALSAGPRLFYLLTAVNACGESPLR